MPLETAAAVVGENTWFDGHSLLPDQDGPLLETRDELVSPADFAIEDSTHYYRHIAPPKDCVFLWLRLQPRVR